MICDTPRVLSPYIFSVLLQHLFEAAVLVQTSKDNVRPLILTKHMESLDSHLGDNSTPIPLSPSLIANGITSKASSYFPSNTVPLKVVFTTSDTILNMSQTEAAWQSGGKGDPSAKSTLPIPNNTIPVIFKVKVRKRCGWLLSQANKLVHSF